ncbi:MAG: phosphate acyltransferase, partial [Mariprofundaceae bacterium]|nr:phosphate acyltransferase [Mariprofundaceae bacterium]
RSSDLVAKAAADSGVAQKPLADMAVYQEQLAARVDTSRLFMRLIMDKARTCPLTMALPEGEDETVIRAASIMREQGIAKPVLIGCKAIIEEKIKALGLEDEGIDILDPCEQGSRLSSLIDAYYFDRKRQGILHQDAELALSRDTNVLAAMMVKQGFADGMLSGRTAHYPTVLRPVLQVLGHNEGGHHYHVYGLYMMIMEKGAFFFCDTSVNVDMDAEQLAELAVLAAETAASLGFEPRVAMLSFSNFGSAPHSESRKVADAVQLLHERHPDMVVDGEMQADTALNPDLLAEYPFNHLKGAANVLVFPTMQAGNIAYKLVRDLGNGTAIGPILLGLPKQAHVLQTGASADDIVNIAAIAAARAADQHSESQAG